jgi:hypothetical protein
LVGVRKEGITHNSTKNQAAWSFLGTWAKGSSTGKSPFQMTDYFVPAVLSLGLKDFMDISILWELKIET